jgi:hypothetical protein
MAAKPRRRGRRSSLGLDALDSAAAAAGGLASLSLVAFASVGAFFVGGAVRFSVGWSGVIMGTLVATGVPRVPPRMGLECRASRVTPRQSWRGAATSSGEPRAT